MQTQGLEVGEIRKPDNCVRGVQPSPIRINIFNLLICKPKSDRTNSYINSWFKTTQSKTCSCKFEVMLQVDSTKNGDVNHNARRYRAPLTMLISKSITKTGRITIHRKVH
ncbi:hypothetical protein M758_3G246900 [Ceratodon purpureus]|nr:hypothetical protein M758_3G246900 [Ceratodon purpureus]